MITSWKRAALALTLVFPLAAVGQPAFAADTPACVAPVPSTTQPGYTVLDPNWFKEDQIRCLDGSTWPLRSSRWPAATLH